MILLPYPCASFTRSLAALSWNAHPTFTHCLHHPQTAYQHAKPQSISFFTSIASPWRDSFFYQTQSLAEYLAFLIIPSASCNTIDLRLYTDATAAMWMRLSHLSKHSSERACQSIISTSFQPKRVAKLNPERVQPKIQADCRVENHAFQPDMPSCKPFMTTQMTTVLSTELTQTSHYPHPFVIVYFTCLENAWEAVRNSRECSHVAERVLSVC